MNRLFIFTLSILLSFAALANKQTQTSALKDLVESLNKIKTLSATFVQYSVDQRGARIQESRGELKADRGGKFYWRTYEPLEQVVISDGKEVTVYDPDLEQATVQAVGSQVQTTPAILSSGDTQKIGQLFEVEVQRSEPAIRQFFLKPKTEDSLFEGLKLRFTGSNVSELRITDALGQESTMSFIQTQINQVLPEDTFELKFPAGTDIIRDVPMPDH